MNFYNRLHSNMPYYQVWIFTSLMFALILGILSYFIFDKAIAINIAYAEFIIKFSLSMGVIVGGLFTTMIGQYRMSQRFWEASEIYEVKLNEASDLEELSDLYDGHEKLKRLANGPPHYSKLREFIAVYNTKYSIFKKI